MIKNYHLKVIIIAIICVRFFFDLCGNYNIGHLFPNKFTAPQHKAWERFVLPDDMEIGRSAHYFIQTNKFLVDCSMDRPKIREENIWPSAFRNRYNILYQVLIIKFYELKHGPIKVDSSNNLPVSYFALYSIILFCFKWLFSFISIIYLYRCARLFLSDFMSLIFLIAWQLYPSNFYVFPLNSFDSCSAPIITIIICQLILLAVQKKIDYKQIVFLGLMCCWAFTLKFHICAVTFSMCLFAIIFGAIKKNGILAYSFAGVLLLHACVFVPLLISTNNTLGHTVISTQSAINFFHGHNPIARGSWTQGIWVTYPEILNPMLNAEKKNLSADEYTETETYKKMAIQWILSHPKEEGMLSIKKVAIFFLPYNFINWQLNPITLFFHLGFLSLTILMLVRPRQFTIEYWLVIVAVWGMVALNVLYFVEYRWRYLVEPEMILATFILIKIVYDKIRRKKQTMPAY